MTGILIYTFFKHKESDGRDTDGLCLLTAYPLKVLKFS